MEEVPTGFEKDRLPEPGTCAPVSTSGWSEPIYILKIMMDGGGLRFGVNGVGIPIMSCMICNDALCHWFTSLECFIRVCVILRVFMCWTCVCEFK